MGGGRDRGKKIEWNRIGTEKRSDSEPIMAGGGLFIRRSQVVKQPELEYGSIGITADSTSPSTSQSNDDDDDDVDLTDVKSRKMSTISSGVVNLANTIVGAGMLGLPGAFGGTGWLSGIILIIVSAIFSAHGLVLLSKSAIITGKPASFYSVAHASVPRYTMLIDAAVAVKCFGVATGYLITISDSMVNALHHMLMSGDIEREPTFIISLLLSRHFWVVGAILSVLPLSFYRTLDELKKASALALVFVFMLVGMILAYANGLADPCSGNELETCKGDMEPYTNFSSTISKLPIFVFAFTCHQNIFPIVNELELLSQKRLNIVITCSICFALVIFSTVAIEGYRTYGSNVRGDILLNYPENRQVTFLRICIAGMLALHYPLQLDPSRRCVTSFVKAIIQWWRQKGEDTRRNNSELEHQSEEDVDSYVAVETEPTDNPNEDDRRSLDDRLFYIITFVFISLSFILAMIVDDLGIVLALVGSTGSTLVSYVLPGLIYIKVAPQKDAALAMAYVQLCLGLVLMPLALYYVLTKAAHH